MICLGYLSSATGPMSADDLASILAASRRNNPPAGVTGLLCYYDGSFLQFLEGEPEAVRAAYARIGGDPRHAGLIKICERPITARAFGDWSMGVARPEAMGPEERALVSELRTIAPDPAAPHYAAIAPFLETFRAWLR